MDWRPIETIPLKAFDDSMEKFFVSDGRRVWVCTVDVWSDGRAEYTDELSREDDLYGKDEVDASLTHWAPFPSPPHDA